MNQNLAIPLPIAQAIAALGVKVESELHWKYATDFAVKNFPNIFSDYIPELIKEKWIQDPAAAVTSSPAYTLGELPAVLEAIGKMKGWEKEESCFACKNLSKFCKNENYEGCGPFFMAVQYEFLEICRLYVEEPKKGWEYLSNLLK